MDEATNTQTEETQTEGTACTTCGGNPTECGHSQEETEQAAQ